ncbi:hypothetical protein EV421DRAFT_1731199 [Armillaria borealis]|uniref:Uncharacterized protein n=1 Tax=Armillaria borealis TaxID=47425 RepID=A0AA39K140_9AGAR|nr:hypothetical protein EV421DRAFT_1731199 [Armillaria borealis]
MVLKPTSYLLAGQRSFVNHVGVKNENPIPRCIGASPRYLERKEGWTSSLLAGEKRWWLSYGARHIVRRGAQYVCGLSQRVNTSKKITDPWRGGRAQAMLDLEREVGLAVVFDEDEEGGEDKEGLEIRLEPDDDDRRAGARPSWRTRWIHWIHQIQGRQGLRSLSLLAPRLRKPPLTTTVLGSRQSSRQCLVYQVHADGRVMSKLLCTRRVWAGFFVND